jgi:hypothetical protein
VATVCDNAREAGPCFPGPFETRHGLFDDPAVASGTAERQMQVIHQVLRKLLQNSGGFLICRSRHDHGAMLSSRSLLAKTCWPTAQDRVERPVFAAAPDFPGTANMVRHLPIFAIGEAGRAGAVT